MKNSLVPVVLGIIVLMPSGHAQDANSTVEANTDKSVNTGMNGKSSTNAQVPISSTASSAESRSITGSGD